MSAPCPSRVRVDGPLARYAAGFRDELSRLGYSASPAAGHLQLMAHLSRWMAGHVAARMLDDDGIEGFLAERRVHRVHRRLTVKGLSPLLSYLRGIGAVPAMQDRVVDGALTRLLDDFTGHLSDERGLAAATVDNYVRVAEDFLAAAVGHSCDIGALAELSAAEVVGFVQAASARLGPGSLNNVTTGLRTLLRFLYLHGLMPVLLSPSVPTAPGWCDPGIVAVVTADEIGRLLASCDRETATGRRDFAILTVLVRLGLRAGEVAALTLADIDWNAGELVVGGKSRRRDRLPLPPDVGEAIADYCRWGRRQNGCRQVFLQGRAPYGGLSGTGVGEVVARACRRAGLSRIGPHRLRHSAARAIRRAGAPLFEIGQVLRHRHVATTAHYARDDHDALAAVVRGWPGGGA